MAATADERTAPDDRLAIRHEELDRDDLDAISLQRLDLAGQARGRDRRCPSSGARSGPVMSASRRPTDAPSIARAVARLTDTLLLPTPPLPDATAMRLRTPGMRFSERTGFARHTIADQGQVDRSCAQLAGSTGRWPRSRP